ncbi:MAG: DUF3888 domain-containing protein [Clostridiales bacterium]|nr:DUF3888 domain-containing protein [Clostridiales bacterium]
MNSVNVINVERPNGYRTFFFTVTLQISPYTGPHISVGLDNITVAINGSGNVSIEKYEHIESFNLPPHYEHIIKGHPKNSQ